MLDKVTKLGRKMTGTERQREPSTRTHASPRINPVHVAHRDSDARHEKRERDMTESRAALARLRTCWGRLYLPEPLDTLSRRVAILPLSQQSHDCFQRRVDPGLLALRCVLIFVLFSLGSTISWTVAEEVERPPCAQPGAHLPLCFGLSIATLVQCFGHISGAHLNPAVTAAMVVTKNPEPGQSRLLPAGPVSRLCGGSCRSGTVNTSISAATPWGCGSLHYFQLVFTVFASCDPKRSDLSGSPALAIGLSVCIGHLFAVNPLYWSQHEPSPFLWSCHGHLELGKPWHLSTEYLFCCPNPELKKHYSQARVQGAIHLKPSTGRSRPGPAPTCWENSHFSLLWTWERAERRRGEQEIEVSGATKATLQTAITLL
ncbi:Aquaporin-4 [Merluccius polli]|uniref:Aquaporin-4 n=1 Tax=Merluccius polli TaxID=89951 RepID=A0AA47N514_MERPO|nr:Aquaporin-4 [Merluccius polli]